jgi:hypothetical protein
MMTNEVAIHCRCGEMAGRAIGLSGSNGNRLVCYCRDCQSFARYLGHADDILDANGGTDIYQTSPGRLQIDHGLERLACVRLTENGVIRWYADCCRTPVGNTLANLRVPFVGLIHRFVDPGDASFDELWGPVGARVFARHAIGDRAGLDEAISSQGSAPGAIWAFFKLLVRARLSGTHRSSPFVTEDGARRAEPMLIDPAERARLGTRD